MDGHRSFGVHLGVDVGTSNTAAAVHDRAKGVRSVLFDGAPLLPSAVFVDGDVTVVGADALHAAATRPALLEPNPKRCIDDGTVLLGTREVTVETLLAAVLSRVRAAAEEFGSPIDTVTLTYPVAWGPRRLASLVAAARLAGLPEPATMYEPIAAATHYVDLPVGALALVYDLGAGTFDATLVRRTDDGFDVVASHGLSDAGGLDIDAAIIASIQAHCRPDDDAWAFLREPRTPADLRERRALMEHVRRAKEALSRSTSTSIHVPVLDEEVPLGREQFDALARPVLDRTIGAVKAALRDADVSPADLAAIFLVGGSTRIPLVGTLLHRALGRPPEAADQPELAVAYGSVERPAGTPTQFTLPAADETATVVSEAVPPRREEAATWLPRGRRLAAALVLALVLAATVAFSVGRYNGWTVRRDTSGFAVSTASGSPSGPASLSSGPVTIPSATARPAVPDPFVGQWTGTVSQPTGRDFQSWQVTVTFTATSDIGSFRTSTLNCEGTLTVVSPTPTDREMRLRQRTTVNPYGDCVEAADWTLIANSGGGIDMYWQEFGNQTNRGTAVLTKS